MRNAKAWLAAVFAAVALVGAGMLLRGGTPMVLAAPAAAGPDERDHWRNYDGHWSYWHAEDKRWYYTDGHHWFFHDGKGWMPYKFDKKFGREGFEKGEYKIPGDEIRGYAPRHDVHRFK